MSICIYAQKGKRKQHQGWSPLVQVRLCPVASTFARSPVNEQQNMKQTQASLAARGDRPLAEIVAMPGIRCVMRVGSKHMSSEQKFARLIRKMHLSKGRGAWKRFEPLATKLPLLFLWPGPAESFACHLVFQGSDFVPEASAFPCVFWWARHEGVAFCQQTQHCDRGGGGVVTCDVDEMPSTMSIIIGGEGWRGSSVRC